jgi:hypothetical protein
MADDTDNPQKMDDAALAMARRFGLLRDDGTVHCIKDNCDGDATLPTLECQAHVDYRTRKGRW